MTLISLSLQDLSLFYGGLDLQWDHVMLLVRRSGQFKGPLGSPGSEVRDSPAAMGQDQ